jgi:DNA repair ATPase RecN
VRIDEFKKLLVSKSVSGGGEFMRTDFHVHLPGSDDYEYKGEDKFELMAKTLNDGNFRIAVVLKHQEFPQKHELDTLQKLCPKTLLIPGAEINVFVDALAKKVGKDYYFHCIVAADPASEWGYILHRAKEELTYRGEGYPSGFTSSITDVARQFTRLGALFIPAHLHQAVKPENSRSIDDVYDDDAFLGFVDSGTFTALEVRKSNTALFFDGTRKTNDGRQIPAAVCVQSSDAHHHDHIVQRNRSTWVQMEHASFAELKAALSFPHRVSLTEPPSTHGHIVGIHVVGSFLEDSWIRFSPRMNCLIGCKGSGKTSVLECLRFVLNTEVPGERKESVQKHIAHILGPGGYVECLLRKVDGTEILVTRRADSPLRATLTDENGVVSELSHRDVIQFDVSILGWHEIEAVADQATARVRLVDRLAGEEDVRRRYENINTSVEKARDLFPALQRTLKNLDQSLGQFWALQKKRRTLAKLEDANLLSLQNEYESYLNCELELKRFREELIARHSNIQQSLRRADKILIASVNESSSPQEVTSAFAQANTIARELVEARGEASRNLDGSLEDSLKKLNQGIESVQTAFKVYRQSVYEPQVNALPDEEKLVLARQIQIIEETKALPELEGQCRSLQADVQAFANDMAAICDSICMDREEICKIRNENIAAINAEISTVQLHFLKSANHAKRDGFQQSYREDASGFFSYVDRFPGNEPYEKLRSLFRQLAHIRVEEENWEVTDLIWDARFVEFLRVFDDDDVSIDLMVGEAGFVPIQNLSAGQRCTAVFPLLLRNSKGPLVIDQPEDNLDNRYIADVIAPDLLKKKMQQQYVATSHNANLVVLTDSDLVIHADSDGKRGRVVSGGFFGCSESKVSLSILDVLDGGKQALEARQRKYGLRTN